MCEERSSVPIQFDRRSVIGSQSGETSISYTWMPIANKCPPSSAKKNTVSNLVVREMQRSSGEMKEKRWRRRRRKEVRVPFFLHMKIDFEFLFFIFPGCSLTQNWRLGCVWGGKCWYRFSLKHNSSRPTTKRKWRFFNHSIIGKTRLTFGRSLNFPFKNSQTDWKKEMRIAFSLALDDFILALHSSGSDLCEALFVSFMLQIIHFDLDLEIYEKSWSLLDDKTFLLFHCWGLEMLLLFQKDGFFVSSVFNARTYFRSHFISHRSLSNLGYKRNWHGGNKAKVRSYENSLTNSRKKHRDNQREVEN